MCVSLIVFFLPLSLSPSFSFILPFPLSPFHLPMHAAFLHLCQTNHYQFDQLRRAKHSSMMVLYHLHNPDEELINKQCNNCEKEIEGERYNCKTCGDEVFNLCKSCYERLYNGSQSNNNDSGKRKKNDPKQSQRHAHPLELVKQKTNEMKHRATNIRLHMTLLVHASACKNRNCPSANCAKMKALLRHGAQVCLSTPPSTF